MKYPTWIITLETHDQVGSTNEFKAKTIDIEVICVEEEAKHIKMEFERLMVLTNNGSPVVKMRKDE